MWTVFKQALRLWKTNASDTAIVLKGGLAKGFGEIAVIRYLQENNIRPKAVIGASSGAQIAAMWAAGMTWQEMVEATSKFQMSLTTSYYELLTERHLFGSQKIRDFFLSYIHNTDVDMESMQKNVGFLSHNLTTKKLELLSKGSLVQCLIASNAHPGIIASQNLPNGQYIDGDIYSGIYLIDDIKHRFKVKHVIGISRELESSGYLTEIILDLLRPDRSDAQCDEDRLDLLLKYNSSGIGYAEFSAIPGLVDSVYQQLLDNEKALQKYLC